MEKLFYHECRANGMVFKTFNEWINYIKKNMNVTEAVAEHFGFKFNINDVCVNPNIKASYKIDYSNAFEVKTARTQYGWVYGYSVNLGTESFSSPAGYPSRYDNSVNFFETEEDALKDAISFIIRQLECKPRRKNRDILLYYAKKLRMDIKHPQMDLFTDTRYKQEQKMRKTSMT